jgi:hypothetical protein
VEEGPGGELLPRFVHDSLLILYEAGRIRYARIIAERRADTVRMDPQAPMAAGGRHRLIGLCPEDPGYVSWTAAKRRFANVVADRINFWMGQDAPILIEDHPMELDLTVIQQFL